MPDHLRDKHHKILSSMNLKKNKYHRTDFLFSHPYFQCSSLWPQYTVAVLFSSSSALSMQTERINLWRWFNWSNCAMSTVYSYISPCVSPLYDSVIPGLSINIHSMYSMKLNAHSSCPPLVNAPGILTSKPCSVIRIGNVCLMTVMAFFSIYQMYA